MPIFYTTRRQRTVILFLILAALAVFMARYFIADSVEQDAISISEQSPYKEKIEQFVTIHMVSATDSTRQMSPVKRNKKTMHKASKETDLISPPPPLRELLPIQK